MRPLSTSAMNLLVLARELVARGSPSLHDALGRAARSSVSVPPPQHHAELVRLALLPAVEHEPGCVTALREALLAYRAALAREEEPTPAIVTRDCLALARDVRRCDARSLPFDADDKSRGGVVFLLSSAIHYHPPKAVQAPAPLPQRTSGWTESEWEREGRYVPDEDDDWGSAQEVP